MGNDLNTVEIIKRWIDNTVLRVNWVDQLLDYLKEQNQERRMPHHSMKRHSCKTMLKQRDRAGLLPNGMPQWAKIRPRRTNKSQKELQGKCHSDTIVSIVKVNLAHSDKVTVS